MAPIRIPSATLSSNPNSSTTSGASTAPPSSGWDYILKFILIGDSSVGKSSLLVRLTDDRFLLNPDPTIGVEFGSHLIQLDNGETVKVQVWDTAGSESFRSITRSYYRGAAGALLVYDVTHRESFKNVKGWLDDVRSNAEEKVCVVLVGNMYDLVEIEDNAGGAGQGSREEPEEVGREERMRRERRRSKAKRRQVTTEEAQQFADQNGLLFLEASAKTGWNVKEAFAIAAKDIHDKFSESADSATAERGEGGGGGGKYDNATLGKRSRTRARTGGRTSGTVALDQPSPLRNALGTTPGGGARNLSGFSIQSLTGTAQPPTEGDGGEQQRDACCIIS